MVDKILHWVILVFAALIAINMAANIWQQLPFFFKTRDLHGQIGVASIGLSTGVFVPAAVLMYALSRKSRHAIWAMLALALATFGGSLILHQAAPLLTDDRAYHDMYYTTVNWIHFAFWLFVYALGALALVRLRNRGQLT